MIWIYSHIHNQDTPNPKIRDYFIVDFGSYKNKTKHFDWLEYWEVGQLLGGN